MSGDLEQGLGEGGKDVKGVPERTYFNIQPRFASLVFTVPHLKVDLPENSSLKPQGELSVSVLNNGRLQIDPVEPDILRGKDWTAKAEIESVNWHDEVISSQRLLAERKTLLGKYFVEMLGSEDAVNQLRRSNESVGLREGSYLYRAVTEDELRKMKREGYQQYSFLDPSANFESEEMFNGEHSQVRHYFGKTEAGYSGSIIRWKLEDPVLYRTSGMAVRRVVPMFSHYIPRETEISNNGGETFEPLFGEIK